MAFVFASLPRPPAPPVDVLKRDGLAMTWTGWDGSEWALDRNSDSGVYLLGGARGLHLPQGTRYRDTSPGIHGSLHRGTQWHERDVYWPIKIWHGGTGPEWMERDRAFWWTLDPERVGRWTVTPSNGDARHLDLRLDPSSPEPGFDTVPSLRRWANYQVYLTADQPFWVGTPSTRNWGAPAPSGPFFEPNGPHVFNISQGFSLKEAVINNLGDVDSPPVWYIDGLAEPGAHVGVGPRRTIVPFEVPAGRCLVIDSDPQRIGATQYTVSASGRAKRPSERIIGVDMVGPVDRSRELGPSDFAPIPPGQAVELSLSLEGTGQVEVSVPSLYKRAW